MIRYIKGVVKLQKNDSSIVVTSDGVGWHVKTGSILLNAGEDVELYIHTQIRENEIVLWGFSNIEDLEIFELLISVNGVGAKLAQTLLSTKGRTNIINSIALNDTAGLIIPGVGKKISEKIVFSLKDKLSTIAINAEVMSNTSQDERDVVVALVQLGYQESYINKVMSELTIDSDMSLQQKIKLVLKNI